MTNAKFGGIIYDIECLAYKGGKMLDVQTVGGKSQVVFCDNLDAENGMPSLEDESVALVLYSPPYYNYMNYAGGKGVGKSDDTYDQYLDDMYLIHRCLKKKVMVGGRVVIVATNMKSRKAIEGETFMYPILHDLVGGMTDVGFTFFDEIVWDKVAPGAHSLGGKPLFGSYPYPPTPLILNAGFENIVIFTKSGNRPKVPQHIKDQCKITMEDWREFTRGIWNIRTDSDKDHPATFPIELAERVVRLYSFTDDLVLDPFSGAGTTVVAAEKWGRIGLGYEIAPEYKSSVVRRTEKHLGVTNDK